MFYLLKVQTMDSFNFAATTMPAALDWDGVAYANNIWVAIGFSDTGAENIVAWSDDGITWNAGSGAYAATYTWTKPVWNGTFWAVNTHGASPNKGMTSSDGKAWTQHNLAGTAFSINNTPGMIAVGSTFIATRGLARNEIYSSTDGYTWTEQVDVLPDDTVTWCGLATNGTITVAVQGYPSGTSNKAASILNANLPGGVWTVRTLPATSNWLHVIWTGNCFFATTFGSPTTGARSYDGITWESLTLPSTAAGFTITLYGTPVAEGNGTIILPVTYTTGNAARNRCHTSYDDGTTWTERTLTETDRWDAAASDGNKVVIIANFDAGSGSTRAQYSSGR